MKLLNLTSALLAFVVLTLFSVGAQATLVNTAIPDRSVYTDILCRTKGLESPYVQNCWRAVQGVADPGNDDPDDEEIWKYFADTVPGFGSAGLLYGADYQNASKITEVGTLADSYTTDFTKDSGKIVGADINFSGDPLVDPSVDCMALTDPCFLLIMGKENSSSNIPFDAYLFNLALGWDSDWDPARRAGGWSVDIPDPNVNKILPSWNGTDILQLTNFGAGQLGSIARVALYGKMSAVSADSTGSAVPVPAAFWLFGTALLGFIGLPRKTGI